MLPAKVMVNDIMILQDLLAIEMNIAPLAVVVTGTLHVVLFQPKPCWKVLIARVADVM